jgi:hypothetical protein
MTTQANIRQDSSLIFQMMQRLGIDPAGGVLPQSGLRYIAAHRNCDGCDSKPACRKWLDAHEVAAFAPPFCPNGDTFFALHYDQHRVDGR